ncbi:MAG: hypothetical protein L3J62_09055 [Gammaproteobacteria bacterium]|nr:hypothetical protein [Gammaproteobacteria bacterium]MCF6230920.1 hypothetical protein [Gammaproteobacteria bacterium]
MLIELYHYLTTPCPRAHRQLGYLTGMLGLQARHRRVQDHWQQHLENCRQFILKSVLECNQYSKVTIIGSGLLLEVPLEQLSIRFNEVILIDMVQPRAIRKRCHKLGNVTPLVHDITGLAAALVDYKRGDKLPTPRASLPDAGQSSNLIISCNLLTQLPHTPSHFLQYRHGWHEDDPQLQQWQHAIMEDHLLLLSRDEGACCLICDTHHNYRDKAGQSVAQESRLLGLSLGSANQEWLWPIAPLGELNKQLQLIATVQGFYNWP